MVEDEGFPAAAVAVAPRKPYKTTALQNRDSRFSDRRTSCPMTLRDFRSVLPALLLGMALCLAGSATPSAKTVREATVRQPAAPPPAQGTGGNSVERIAAVVNDDIISVSDLQTRIQLAIVATGLPDSPEARSK